MNLDYVGIQLLAPAGKVSMSHSVILDAIRGQSSTENMEWTSILCDLPWGKLKEALPEAYENTGRLCSLMHLDYQVCNGGIAQYFCNYYDEPREPRAENDVKLYGIEDQKVDFADMVKFARDLFPNRTEENQTLETAQQAFEDLQMERDAETSEWIECDEDEYIIDEETGEEVKNPDWFEDYEESYEEDYIHNEAGFDDKFYEANEYLEELFEYFAQLQCRLMARDIGTIEQTFPEAAKILKEAFPEEAFKKPSLSSVLQNASFRAGNPPAGGKVHHENVLEK